MNNLNEVAADSSRLAKEAILTREKDNVLLQRVLKAAYDPTINYWIKKIPEYKTTAKAESLDWAVNELQYLADRTYTGNAGIDHLKFILESLSADDATIIARIIDRDLRIGCGESTANKVWPGLIFTFDVLLCHKDTSGIKYPAFAQLKGDGMRCHLYFNGKSATAWSRKGKQIELGSQFDATAAKIMLPGETLDGELLVRRNGKILDRKTGNGIINKAIKGTISDAEAAEVVFMPWDIVDFTGAIEYVTRLDTLTKRLASNPVEKFILCPTEIVNSEADAQSFYLRMRADGQEGAVIKNFSLLWEGKRVKGAGKMKAVEEADLKIVGIQEGTGKYEGMLGAFEMETSDGKVHVCVGIGFSDDDRARLFNKKYIGRIGTVAYNEIINDKRTGKFSLFLPRWIELREDKNVANSFGELK